ncbi:MAG TPA: hypothetical protein VIJ46_04485, partial [Rhabdochlamydiaceae bacterium]
MENAEKLATLRQIITENLRVQRDAASIDYVNVGTAFSDARAKQNHTIFARRGCGKTLLLHHSARSLPEEIRSIYLNCEYFKRHTFPNVLIEILTSIFREVESNLAGWFGKKKRSRELVQDILRRLAALQKSADVQSEDVKRTSSAEDTASLGAGIAAGARGVHVKADGSISNKRREEIERTFKLHKVKLQELDRWLPELKAQIREFFNLSSTVKAIFLQIDDLYHLRRTDQAFVVDYIHRLCKDLPIYFKIATLRHASTLYADRDGQPIGAQERHDYQPINIDYTFNDFPKTERQNWEILKQFGARADMTEEEVKTLFKGQGFSRLVMAGGGVPRDVLSLFLEALSTVQAQGGDRIGKDEVRILSLANFERRIEELKQDSQDDEQDNLLRGIYILREFCFEKETNLFVVQERMLQQNDGWRTLFNRLMDYRIIHNCANALTHKSQPGTYQAFAIDIGCYAHFRKLVGRFNEIDVSDSGAKEKMRSAPVLEASRLTALFDTAPADI